MDIDTIIAQAQAVVDALNVLKNQPPVVATGANVEVVLDIDPNTTTATVVSTTTK